jgi:hypothetical protein
MKVSTTHPLARSGLDCAIAQLQNALSQPILEAHVRYELDAAASELVIISLDETTEGEIGKYRGTARFAYGKAGLDKVLPYPLVCTLGYPTTYRLLKQWMWETYGVLLEEGEFALSSAPTYGLVNDDPVNVAPAAGNSFVELIALPASGRWKTGTTLRLQVVGSVAKTHLNDQVSMPMAADLSRLTDLPHQQYFAG